MAQNTEEEKNLNWDDEVQKFYDDFKWDETDILNGKSNQISIAGDVSLIYHTFLLIQWPCCKVRFFYVRFYGTIFYLGLMLLNLPHATLRFHLRTVVLSGYILMS